MMKHIQLISNILAAAALPFSVPDAKGAYVLHPQAPRSYRRSRSKYMPHQGVKECARRVRQMTKAAS